MKCSGFRTACVVAFTLATLVAISSRLRAQAVAARVPTAIVHVQVFGPFGDKISPAEIHLLSVDAKRDLAQPGAGPVVADVPYGYYILSAWDSAGGIGERAITVNTKDVWVRIGVHFLAGDRLTPPGVLVITGEIRPTPNEGDWWTRVEGVFLNESKESPVSKSGRFSIGGLDMGTYLVEVFEGSKLRHIETVEIDPKQLTTHLMISIPQ